jgi:hypothetical protein
MGLREHYREDIAPLDVDASADEAAKLPTAYAEGAADEEFATRARAVTAWLARKARN